jgi:hypothetical protein
MRHQFTSLVNLQVPAVKVEGAGQFLGVGVVGDVVGDDLVVDAELVGDAAAVVPVDDAAVLVHCDGHQHPPLLD